MMNKKHLLTRAVAAALALSAFAAVAPAQDAASPDAGGAPQIALDKSPAIIAYQLKRLSNAQLVAVDRNAEEAKFKPIYQALLTRKGIDKKYREEAVEALAKINKADPATVLLDAIGGVNAEDTGTLRELSALLVAQKPAVLAAQKEKITAMAKEAESPAAKAAAFAALATADAKPDDALQVASEGDGMKALLAGVPLIADAKLRAAFYPKVKELVEKAPDEATQVAAIDAISSVPGHEAEAFKMLAGIVQTGEGDRQAAAVRSIGRIPASKWPKDQLAPLADAIVKLVEKTPAAERTSPAVVQAVQLGNDVGTALGGEKGAAARKALRGLAVRVVLVRTMHEQMMYDLRYFTVQAGKPVQVILDNTTDTMPHNIVFTAPGALQEIALTAGAMQASDDPNAKQFVPESPKVLHATKLIQPGESTTLSFTAPEKPGNYPFLCTYPGHWVKMYGVMQVVADMDQYDQKPVPPKDPLTRKPIESPRNESTLAPADHAEHQH